MSTALQRRVTLADVAHRCGVSIATVSYVVNGGNGTISEATRERVRQVAAEMGYRPNAAAGMLRRGHANVVLLVLPSGPHRSVPEGLLEQVEADFCSAGEPVLMHAYRTIDLLLTTTWMVQPKVVVIGFDTPPLLEEKLRENGAPEVITRSDLVQQA
jgi:DNA-binding LacI/PurR family transcriptional regulator